MFTTLTEGLARAHRAELEERAGSGRFRRDEGLSWEAVTVRMATAADRDALERLAALYAARRPRDPVLLGVIAQRPVAALSLSDGRVVANPFRQTGELVELLRLRGKQMSGSAGGRGRLLGALTSSRRS